MNSDFRISVTFPDHPKTLSLIRSSGIAAPYRLIRLWAWAATHRPEGDLAGIPDEDLEAVMYCREEPTPLIPALQASGFIEGRPGNRRVHDWKDHNGYASAARKRQELARLAGKASAEKRREDAISRLQSNGRSTDRSTLVRNPVSVSVSGSVSEGTTDSHPEAALPGVLGAVATPPAKPPRQVDGEDGEALRRFGDGHLRVLGAPYTAAFARDRKILRDLIHQNGLARTLEMIDAFWTEQAEPDTDPRALMPVKRARPDIPGFYHQIPNLQKTWHWDTPIGGKNAKGR